MLHPELLPVYKSLKQIQLEVENLFIIIKIAEPRADENPSKDALMGLNSNLNTIKTIIDDQTENIKLELITE